MPSTSIEAAPARLLIVDDIADNRELLARYFGRYGYSIVEAEDGERALALAADGGIDLVLLDVMLPGMSGLEVLKRLRSADATAELPVIMVSALSDSRDIVQGLGLGANDYIAKPVDLAVARARVDNQLRRVGAAGRTPRAATA